MDSRIFKSLLICLIAISMARGNTLMINEVCTHQDGSYIEILNDRGNEESLNGMGFFIADRVNVKNYFKLRFRMIITLSGSIKRKFGLIHFGQLPLESLVTPSLDFRRHYAMGYDDNSWMKIEPGNFLSIFLLKDIGNAPLPNKPKHIEGDLLTFLQEQIMDYIVIRNANGPSSCAKIDEVVAEKVSTSDFRKMYGGNTKKYLETIYNFPTDFDANIEPTKEFSVSKCGPTKPFDIRGYMNTKSTPLGQFHASDNKYYTLVQGKIILV